MREITFHCFFVFVFSFYSKLYESQVTKNGDLVIFPENKLIQIKIKILFLAPPLLAKAILIDFVFKVKLYLKQKKDIKNKIKLDSYDGIYKDTNAAE